MARVNIKSVNLKKLEETFKAMENEKGLLGLALMEEINFQKATLTKMRQSIEKDNLTSEYNGYQRSNPIIAGYNAMINNYSKLIRQAVELLPKESLEEANADDIMNEEF